MAQTRIQLVAFALKKYLGVSSDGIERFDGADLKTLYTTITNRIPSDDVLKWLSFAEDIPSEFCDTSMPAIILKLNQELISKSVVLGNGFTPTEVDVVLYAVVHRFVIALPLHKHEELRNLVRWMCYIQSQADFGEEFVKLKINRPPFDFDSPLSYLKSLQQSTNNPKMEVDSVTNKASHAMKDDEKLKKNLNEQKAEHKGVRKGISEPITEKKVDSKGIPSNDSRVDEKDNELSVSLLNIQVGVIRKAWKHPSADSLLVEEIDVGDSKLRQVVSGLAKYCNPDELTTRRVVLITNVKPGKLRDVMSEGLVLCASNEDHSVVEPLLPPEGAVIGERITFSGVDGKPEDVLNPKKKQLEKITPNLFTDDNGVATFKGIPFMTSGGPCSSSLPNAPIK